MGIFNPGNYMTDDEKNEVKLRGAPVLLIVLGAFFVLIGVSMAPDGLILAAFGALCVAVAILKMKHTAAADARRRRR